ncbi:MAG: hypothetical protein V3V20_09295 [Algisphaera sp.]
MSGVATRHEDATAAPTEKPALASGLALVSSSNPADVWKAVLENAGRGASSAWMSQFELSAWDAKAGAAMLVPRPGVGGGGKSLATDERLARLGKAIGAVTGNQVVRVTLGAAIAREADGEDQAMASPGEKGDKVDRREALSMPLVREVLDVFPEATFLAARKRRGHGVEDPLAG